ncbi:MAG: hypothetical protein GF330_10115 [Candidatus Eisenbacteria bacterium]|nr:hypothetical protein [Candidatus Eisenbacteria bacterium]
MRACPTGLPAIVVLLLACLQIGCSEQGEVELQNGTQWPATGTLNARSADLESGEVMGISVSFDRFLVWGPDEQRVDYRFEGWTAFPQGGSVWAEPDATHRITVLADAGCLGVSNETAATVDAVYLAPPSAPNWGEDLLGGCCARVSSPSGRSIRAIGMHASTSVTAASPRSSICAYRAKSSSIS